MSRKTVVLENIDMELLSQQKRDLLDIIDCFQADFFSLPSLSKKIKSLDGLLHMIDYIQDKIEKG